MSKSKLSIILVAIVAFAFIVVAGIVFPGIAPAPIARVIPRLAILAEPTQIPTPTRVPATSVPAATAQSALAMSSGQHVAVSCPSNLSLAQGDLACLVGQASPTPIPPTSTAIVMPTDTPNVMTSVTPSVTTIATSTVTPTSVAVTGPTWYVAKNGSNTDGRSPANAWTELANINWAVIQPGDTVQVAAGTYLTSLVPAKSGTSAKPITVRATGPVSIFGGRSFGGVPFQLPETDFYTAANPPPAYTTPLNVGIDFSINSPSYVIVDGGGWDGITVYGFSAAGVKFGGSSNNTVRNATIKDNGSIYLNGPSGTYRTRNPGVYPNGTNNTIDRVQVRDNGEDSLQTGQSLSNFTIKNSWLSNSRGNSKYSAQVPWNNTAHSDGFQSYSGGTTTGITIDSSVIGPGQMQGTILGQSGSSVSIVNGVTIRNSLFINDFNAGVMGYAGSPSQGWLLDHVTIYENSYPGNYIPGLSGWSHSIYLEGGGHRVTNSIVYGGDITLPSGTTFSNNCQFGLTGGTIGGTMADPQFTRKPTNTSLANSAAADFTVNNPACAGRGSSITSVSQLLSQ